MTDDLIHFTEIDLNKIKDVRSALASVREVSRHQHGRDQGGYFFNAINTITNRLESIIGDLESRE